MPPRPDARCSPQRARQKKNFAYVPGVTAADSAAIKAKRLDTVGLANARAEDLAISGNAADLERWTRILTQFQTYVPRGAWQLDTSALGLNATDRSVLAENKLGSLGALSRALEEDAVLVTKLGWSAEKLAGTKQQIGEKLGAAHAQLGTERALDTVLAGQGANTAPLAEKLTAQGIDSVAKLADADPAALAKKLGLDKTATEKIVREAMVATLTDKAGLSADAAEKLVTNTKATRLTDFEAVTPEKVNTILKTTTDAPRISGALGGLRLRTIR